MVGWRFQPVILAHPTCRGSKYPKRGDRGVCAEPSLGYVDLGAANDVSPGDPHGGRFMQQITQLPGPSTLAVHAGERPDPVTRASSPNIVMSTTFVADSDATFSVEGFGEDPGFFYTRWGNPTVQQLEQKLSALERSEGCIAFASGMAAVSAVLFYLCRNGGACRRPLAQDGHRRY